MIREMNDAGSAYKWLVLVTISIANFLAALDMSIVVVSFPRLVEVFSTTASTVVWLAIAFSIGELGLLLTLAKVGDAIGRKKMYIVGLVIYTLGLVSCSISVNITMLIISRVIQGAGAAMAITIGSAIVIAVFPREQQGRAIGIFSILMSAGLIAGPALGGFLIDVLDWQGIFYTRIPLGIISLIMALMIIKEQRESNARFRLDAGGAVTLLISTACLLLYLNLGSDWGYFSTRDLLLLAGAIVFGAAFIYIERKAPQPILDLNLFKNRVLSMASITNLIQMTSGSMAPVLIPFFLMGGLDLSASTVGILMAIIAVPPLILSPISGTLSDKIGNRIPMVIATCCFSAALFLASRLGMESSIRNIGLVMLMFGFGIGIFTAPNQSAIVGAAPSRNLASAMGVANTARLLGSAIGMAVAGSLYAYQLSINQAKMAGQAMTYDLLEKLIVVESYQYVILIAAFISIVPILTSLLAGRRNQGSN